MSAITINGDLVHYEVLGRGKPIIFLHSWLGSWRYWVPVMQQLSVKYRTYALDLWGFGDSGKNSTQYSLEGQTALLREFVSKMGIPKAVFIGHGLGAAIAAHFAVDPETKSIVHRLMVVCPPLYDMAPRPLTANNRPAAAITAPEKQTAGTAGEHEAPTLVKPPLDRERLRQAALDAGLEGIAARQQGKEPTARVPSPAPPEAQKTAASPPSNNTKSQLLTNPLASLIGDTDPQTLLSKHMDTSSSDYEKLKTEVAKTALEAIPASVESFKRINTFRELLEAAAPTLALLGKSDSFMKVPEQTVIDRLERRQQFKLELMDGVRHFPMLEDSTLFTRWVRDFLDAPNVSELRKKDEWQRRTR